MVNIMKNKDINKKNNRRKPNVLCVGFAKCGTTTLYDIMSQHSEIYLSKIKEPVYYSSEYVEPKGFEWYLKRYYPKKCNKKVIMEINPLIARSNIPDKILRDFGPDTKIIFMIRNPVKRMYSNFKMNLLPGINFKTKKEHLEGNSSILFDKWVKENFIKDGENLKIRQVRQTKFYRNGTYLENIKGYYEKFSSKNIRVYIFEDFIANPEKICKDIFDFIGVNYQENINYNIHSNELNFKPTLIGMWILDKWFAYIWPRFFIKKLPYCCDGFSSVLNKISWKLPEIVSKRDNEKVEISKFAEDIIISYYYDSIKELEGIIGIDLFEKWGIKRRNT